MLLWYYGKFFFVVLVCGWPIFNLSGEIVSPGFPYNIQSGDCTWSYSAPDNNSILLITFTHFNLPFTGKCR